MESVISEEVDYPDDGAVVVLNSKVMSSKIDTVVDFFYFSAAFFNPLLLSGYHV